MIKNGITQGFTQNDCCDKEQNDIRALTQNDCCDKEWRVTFGH
jgi:hypothetical protein